SGRSVGRRPILTGYKGEPPRYSPLKRRESKALRLPTFPLPAAELPQPLPRRLQHLRVLALELAVVCQHLAGQVVQLLRVDACLPGTLAPDGAVVLTLAVQVLAVRGRQNWWRFIFSLRHDGRPGGTPARRRVQAGPLRGVPCRDRHGHQGGLPLWRRVAVSPLPGREPMNQLPKR